MSAPLITIGDPPRQFSFGKLSATNAVRVHVALLKVLGEPMVKLMVLGKNKAEAPKHLSNQHASEPPAETPLPGVTPPRADDALHLTDKGKAEAEATDDFSVMGVSLSGDDILTIGTAIGLLADRMREDEFIALLTLVCSSVRCDGRPITNIDVTFGDGGSLEMYRVFWEALKANFAGFFPASLLASVRKAKQK
jgi:hypothetical protein